MEDQHYRDLLLIYMKAIEAQGGNALITSWDSDVYPMEFQKQELVDLYWEMKEDRGDGMRGVVVEHFEDFSDYRWRVSIPGIPTTIVKIPNHRISGLVEIGSRVFVTQLPDGGGYKGELY